jgi:hypothetical protein
VRPLQKVTNDADKPWYSSVPLGKHITSLEVKEHVLGGWNEWSQNQVIVYGRLLLRTCSGVVRLKSSYKSRQDIAPLKRYSPTYERLDDIQHKAASSLLSNTPGKPRSMTYSQHLMSATKAHSFNVPSTSSHAYAPPMPALNLHDLHGCTVNINYTPQPMIQSTTTTTEAEYDIFSQFEDIF